MSDTSFRSVAVADLDAANVASVVSDTVDADAFSANAFSADAFSAAEATSAGVGSAVEWSCIDESPSDGSFVRVTRLVCCSTL